MRLKAKKNKNGEKKESQNRKRKERKQTEAKTDYSFSRADHFVNRGALDSILYPIAWNNNYSYGCR